MSPNGAPAAVNGAARRNCSTDNDHPEPDQT
jgi:hypothetical protein